MTLELVLELLSLLLLVFIAAELSIIARELAQTRIILLKERKSHETGQTAASGQTINVNLGTVPSGSSSVTIPGNSASSVSSESMQDDENSESSAQSKKETKSPDPEMPEFHVKATPVSLFAVKCPKCQAENSSYRSECYNCGGAL